MTGSVGLTAPTPLMRLGRTDEAIECLKKALALKPDSVNTVWTLAFYSYIGRGHNAGRTMDSGAAPHGCEQRSQLGRG